MTVESLVKELKKWPPNALVLRLDDNDKDALLLVEEVQSLALHRSVETEPGVEIPVVLRFVKLFVAKG
jgi:hypothetical protein